MKAIKDCKWEVKIGIGYKNSAGYMWTALTINDCGLTRLGMGGSLPIVSAMESNRDYKRKSDCVNSFEKFAKRNRIPKKNYKMIVSQ